MADKRKFEKNCVSRRKEVLEVRGYHRFWIRRYINQRAKKEVEAVN